MSRKMIVGWPFAYGFYSPELHKARPASTYAFSRLRRGIVSWHSHARVVNILWRGAHMEVMLGESLMTPEQRAEAKEIQRADIAQTLQQVEAVCPDATYRGIFTTTNVLVSPQIGGVRVVGPPVNLNDFEDGPITRIDPPRAGQARQGILKLVADRSRPVQQGPETAG